MASRVEAKIDQQRAEKLKLAMRRALKSVGIMLEGAAVLNVPVDTGRLRGSITFATLTDRDGVRAPAMIGDGVERPFRENVVHIGTNVEYAQHIEYGTRFMRAQAYLRPALDENRSAVKQVFKDAITRAVVNG